MVASHTEAWIETEMKSESHGASAVASHTEAWIETGERSIFGGRDLVASHTEAWIETRTSAPKPSRRRSPPTRRRGSKQ